MGEIETSGPDAERFLQRLLSNDVTRSRERGAQYSVLCREDGGVLDDLFTYRLAEDRFLTVTNASNHAKDLAWFAVSTRATSTWRWRTRTSAGPCWPSRARRRAGGRAGRRRAAARAHADRRARGGGRACIVCGTGYTGEDGVELLIPPTRARRLGRADRAGRDSRRARRARHAAPRGLLPPLRQRPDRGPRPDRGRPRLVLRARDGLRRRRPAARNAGPRREARPVRAYGPRDSAPGQPRRRRRRRGPEERHLLAVVGAGDWDGRTSPP